MKRESIVLVLAVVAVLASTACTTGTGTVGDPADRAFPRLTGAYLGQSPPGDEARPFAPGIVSTGMYERDFAMTPDGSEIYFCIVQGRFDHSAITVMRVEDGVWTRPAIAPFSGRYKDLEPAISPDGSKFYFMSFRPREGETSPRDEADIWVMDRTAEGWSTPYNLGPPVNTDSSEFFPSVTTDGTLYFTRDEADGSSIIYRSRSVDGHHQEPERLGPGVNSGRAQFNSYVSPDEGYVIFGSFGREDGFGGGDYYVSFHNDDDTWTGPINLGERINTESPLEYSPYVTPDGKYFFFMAARNRYATRFAESAATYEALREIHGESGNGQPDIFWIDASFIEQLRP